VAVALAVCTTARRKEEAALVVGIRRRHCWCREEEEA
jgi:hypothetical protein